MLGLSPLLQPRQRRDDLFSHRLTRMPLGAHRLDRVRFRQSQDRVALVFVRCRLGAAVAGDFLLSHRVLILFDDLHAKCHVGVLRFPRDPRFLFFRGLVIQDHYAAVAPPSGQGFGDVSRGDVFADTALIPPVAMTHVVETVGEPRPLALVQHRQLHAAPHEPLRCVAGLAKRFRVGNRLTRINPKRHSPLFPFTSTWSIYLLPKTLSHAQRYALVDPTVDPERSKPACTTGPARSSSSSWKALACASFAALPASTRPLTYARAPSSRLRYRSRSHSAIARTSASVTAPDSQVRTL